MIQKLTIFIPCIMCMYVLLGEIQVETPSWWHLLVYTLLTETQSGHTQFSIDSYEK